MSAQADRPWGEKATLVQSETKNARIAIDAMGGDNAPDEIVAGAILAQSEGGVDLTLVGDEARIRPLLGDAAGAIEVLHVPGEIPMDMAATQAMRSARGTSLGHVVEMVREGGTLSRALQRTGEFPPLFIDMILVGEQTGDLAKALERVGRRYDKELNIKIQRLTALVQPVVILVMAAMVGVIAYSIINGIFDAVSGLRPQ